MPNPATTRPTIADLIGRDGFAFVHAAEMRGVLEDNGMTGWDAFAASWDDLGVDTYMADGGRYRRRRHAVFAAGADGIARLEHRPHYQSRDYNALNGGIARWFDPVTEATEASPGVPGHPAHLPARVRHAVARTCRPGRSRRTSSASRRNRARPASRRRRACTGTGWTGCWC